MTAGKIKILLIDDDYEFINKFGWFLERRGYAVSKAGSGSHGIEIAEKEKPHVILCDLLMLDMNGEEVLKSVRDSSPNSILIVMSAYVDDKTKTRLKIVGAHSFIEKIILFKPTEEYIRKVLEEKGIKIGE